MPEQIASLNEKSLKANLRKFVRRPIENTLNGLIEREVSRTSRSERKLTTTSREMSISLLTNTGLSRTQRARAIFWWCCIHTEPPSGSEDTRGDAHGR